MASYTRLLDLISKCPSCKQTVVYPFTQDLRGSGSRKATKVELGILRKLGMDVAWAIEMGVRIPTIRIKNDLWHASCYGFHLAGQQQAHMQKVVNLITQHFQIKRDTWEVKSFPWQYTEYGNWPEGKKNMDLDITGLDHAELLVELYAAAAPQGKGWRQQGHDKPLSIDVAKGILNDVTKSIDYINGRSVKVDFIGNKLRADLYDRDNGEGTAQRVIDMVRARKKS